MVSPPAVDNSLICAPAPPLLRMSDPPPVPAASVKVFVPLVAPSVSTPTVLAAVPLSPVRKRLMTLFAVMAVLIVSISPAAEGPPAGGEPVQLEVPLQSAVLAVETQLYVAPNAEDPK